MMMMLKIKIASNTIYIYFFQVVKKSNPIDDSQILIRIEHIFIAFIVVLKSLFDNNIDDDDCD